MKTTSHGTVIQVGCSVQGIRWAWLMFWLVCLAVAVAFWWGGIADVVAFWRAYRVGL